MKPAESKNEHAIQTEEDMVRCLLADDISVLAPILMAYGPKIRAILTSRFPAVQIHDIEDVLSQGLIAFWEGRKKFDWRKGTLGGWLYVLCRNIAINRLKRKWREQLAYSQIQSHRANDGAIVEDASTDNRKFLLRKVVSQLGLLDQKIVCAYLLQSEKGDWTAQIAKELTMEPNHLRVRWHRLKHLIRKRLEEVSHV
jgi:RNA polymerase sigma factor (sigma-70 family)